MHKRASLLTTLASLVISLAGASARADWNPGGTHKMHFPQLPDPNGYDVMFNPDNVGGNEVRLADDWRCSQSGPVEDIHFWFSAQGDWLDLNAPLDPQITAVTVKIHANVPAALPGQPGLNYSTPGTVLWQRSYTAADFPGKVAFRLYGTGLQSFLRLPFGGVTPNDHQKIFQCNITNLVDPFCQKEGDIYWLEVAIYSAQPLGWKSSDRSQYPAPYTGQHYEDDATYHWQQITEWQEIRYPIGPSEGQSMDLAFVITGSTIPWNHKMHFPQEPDPTGADVLFTRPKILADDWRCSETGPVRDIHFWFSAYNDWLNLSQPLSQQIFNIHVSIHEDVPAGTNEIPYSRPGNVIWERDFSASEVYFSRCDTPGQGWFDPNTSSYIPNNHQALYRCDITQIPGTYIQQQGTIYWLDIMVDSEGPLGWKTADVDHYPAPFTGTHFQDDAVWADIPNPFWTELTWPGGHPKGGQSIDLAFVITKGPTTVGSETPKSYRLMQNFPNPFNPTTTIGYELPERSDVQVAVYSVDGRLVRVLDAGSRPAGVHEVGWDGLDTSGHAVASGVYFYKLVAGSFVETKKMTLLK